MKDDRYFPDGGFAAAGRWAAAHTHPRCEKTVARLLRDRGVRVFLPTVPHRHRYGARERVFELPLFSGYLFFDAEGIECGDVLRTGRVVSVLESPAPEELRRDLENLARTLGGPGEPRRCELGPPGSPVVVAGGPLRGTRGTLVRRPDRGCRLVVAVRFLGFAAEVLIDPALVRPA